MKYELKLAMTGVGNYCCQKWQLIDIPCDHLLAVCSFRRLDYTQYASPYYIIQYYINTWSGHWRQCTMIRSLGQIQQKSTKEGERRYAFQWLWIKWRVISTWCQLEVELVLAKHDLDYQSIYVVRHYICQNNWILIVVVIFQFVWHYFRIIY
jgi:hypothetical protein